MYFFYSQIARKLATFVEVSVDFKKEAGIKLFILFVLQGDAVLTEFGFDLVYGEGRHVTALDESLGVEFTLDGS